MKKVIFGLICLFTLMFTLSPKVKAYEADFSNSILIKSEKEEFNDGSYITYDLYESVNNASTFSLIKSSSTSYTKSGNKAVTKYDSNNKIIWQYILNATFTVDEGSSVICTNTSYTKTINNTFWKFSNGSTTYSGNTAYGKGKFTYKVLWLFSSETVNIDIKLTCDTYGNLS